MFKCVAEPDQIIDLIENWVYDEFLHNIVSTIVLVKTYSAMTENLPPELVHASKRDLWE